MASPCPSSTCSFAWGSRTVSDTCIAQMCILRSKCPFSNLMKTITCWQGLWPCWSRREFVLLDGSHTLQHHWNKSALLGRPCRSPTAWGLSAGTRAPPPPAFVPTKFLQIFVLSFTFPVFHHTCPLISRPSTLSWPPAGAAWPGKGGYGLPSFSFQSPSASWAWWKTLEAFILWITGIGHGFTILAFLPFLPTKYFFKKWHYKQLLKQHNPSQSSSVFPPCLWHPVVDHGAGVTPATYQCISFLFLKFHIVSRRYLSKIRRVHRKGPLRTFF